MLFASFLQAFYKGLNPMHSMQTAQNFYDTDNEACRQTFQLFLTV